jgi:two-component sensor histidine kinase
MAVHELTANAARHGALSVPQGRVHLSWEIEGEEGDQRLVIRWREAGGPKVSPPRSKRYGCALIENELTEQIGATGSIAFEEDGVRSELSLPLAGGGRPPEPHGAGLARGRFDAANFRLDLGYGV